MRALCALVVLMLATAALAGEMTPQQAMEKTMNCPVCSAWSQEPGVDQNIRYDVVNRETIRGGVDIAMRDGGDTIAMKHEMQGRWVGADCGDVKPVE